MSKKRRTPEPGKIKNRHIKFLVVKNNAIF
jgi:hypothetical protein